MITWQGKHNKYAVVKEDDKIVDGILFDSGETEAPYKIHFDDTAEQSYIFINNEIHVLILNEDN